MTEIGARDFADPNRYNLLEVGCANSSSPYVMGVWVLRAKASTCQLLNLFIVTNLLYQLTNFPYQLSHCLSAVVTNKQEFRWPFSLI